MTGICGDYNDNNEDDDEDSDNSLVMTEFSYNNHLLTIKSGI